MERVSFVRPFARGRHFTIVYLRPVFVAIGAGFLLLLSGLLRRLVVVVRRRRDRSAPVPRPPTSREKEELRR